MRNKKLNVFLNLMLATVMLLTCGACKTPGSGSTECEHEGVFIYNCDATVTADGTETGVCTKCGQTITRTAKGTKLTDVGCRTEIVLQGYGTDEDKVVYTKMIKAFNQSEYARRNNLTLRMTQFLADSVYVQGIESGNTLSSDNKVDIIFVNDRYLKKWANAGFMVPLLQKHSSMLDGMYSGLKSSYRYNKNGATSDEDDPLWGVPVAASSTAVYYNRRAMENAGVIVISVADDVVTEANFDKLAAMYAGLTEDMIGKNLLDLWNQNKIADKFGQYRDACGNRDGKTNSGAGFEADVLAKNDIVVPAKGYFRQDCENNYSAGKTWVNPNAEGVNKTVKVFNASIAMNWDELEDLARLLSQANINKNTHGRTTAAGRSEATDYGYYNQWSNDYVRSVGGDFLKDLTGEGTWAFGLDDWSANYLVTANALDKTDENGNKYYLGENTGTHYKAGDTLKYLDKLDVKKFAPIVGEDGNYRTDENGNVVFNDGDMLIPAENGGVRIYNRETGEMSEVLGGTPESATYDGCIRAEIKGNATDDISANPNAKFVVLPSAKAAMQRYGSISAKETGIFPETRGTQIGFDTIKKFAEGKVAMVVEHSSEKNRLSAAAKENDVEWGVAPLAVYKEYKNPQSNDVTVKAEGVKTGVGESIALCITKTSKNADNALKVIKWLTSDLVEVAGTHERAGQYFKAQAGSLSVRPTTEQYSTFIKEDEKNLNLELFFDALEYERPGEWSYLSDNAWYDDVYSWGQNQGSSLSVNLALVKYSYFFGDGQYRLLYTNCLKTE